MPDPADTRPSRPPELQYESAPMIPAGKMLGQMFFGCFITVAIICVAAFISGYLAFAIGYGDDGNSTLSVIVFAIIWLATLALIGLMLGRTRRDVKRRGLHLGLWIGAGLGFLTAGICFSGAMF